MLTYLKKRYAWPPIINTHKRSSHSEPNECDQHAQQIYGINRQQSLTIVSCVFVYYLQSWLGVQIQIDWIISFKYFEKFIECVIVFLDSTNCSVYVYEICGFNLYSGLWEITYSLEICTIITLSISEHKWFNISKKNSMSKQICDIRFLIETKF